MYQIFTTALLSHRIRFLYHRTCLTAVHLLPSGFLHLYFKNISLKILSYDLVIRCAYMPLGMPMYPVNVATVCQPCLPTIFNRHCWSHTKQLQSIWCQFLTEPENCRIAKNFKELSDLMLYVTPRVCCFFSSKWDDLHSQTGQKQS